MEVSKSKWFLLLEELTKVLKFNYGIKLKLAQT